VGNVAASRRSSWLRLAAASGLIALAGMGCTPSTSHVAGSPDPALGPTRGPATQASHATTPPPVGPSQLVLAGALVTRSTAEPSECGYRSGPPRLIFLSDPMPVPSGVARVSFDLLLGPSRTGAYSAVVPLGEYGETPLGIRTARDAAAGAANGLWQATGGTVTVSAADHLGESGSYGSASGTVDALMASTDGKSVRVTGSWQCIIDLGANG
jgi:hypothetical protein